MKSELGQHSSTPRRLRLLLAEVVLFIRHAVASRRLTVKVVAVGLFCATRLGPGAVHPSAPVVESELASPPLRPEMSELTRNLRPGPQVLSQCAQTGDCAKLEDGFLGVDLAAACGPLVGSGEQRMVASEHTTSLDVDTLRFTCRATQQNGRFCNVLCHASAPQTAANQLVEWLADHVGVPDSASIHPRSNHLAHLGFPDLADRRNWTWGRDPELLFEDSPLGGGRTELALSYRGDFDAQ